MSVAHLRLAVPTALLVIAAATATAQHPTAQQVQQALATRPGLSSLVRSKIGASGLSGDQIRARLSAAGYPSTLLDAYLPGSDTTQTPEAGGDVLAAVRALGLADANELETAQNAGAATAQLAPQAPARTTQVAAQNPIFGLDVFRRSTSQFEPDLAGPVDASYKVGPRDVLALILTGGVETSYTLEVTREGFIVVPQVGQVYVANLTLGQIEDVLYNRLKAVYSGIGRGSAGSTHYYVTVAKLRTNQVFVIGDVTAPGSYQVSSAGTMLTALYAAGGPNDNGTLRDVQLKRDGKIVDHLDIYDYLIGGNSAGDARLETGDVVFVPVHSARVKISGEVIRPATYELGRAETLRDLIQMAGGFTATAGRRRVLVHRIVPATERSGEGGRDRTVLDISSDQFASGYGPALPLEDGDEVEVFGIAARVRNHITVDGAVWTPGSQGYVAGMTLSDALKRAGGVKPDVKDVLISRLQSDQTRAELRTSFVDSLGTPANDLALQEDDSLVVFGQRDFRPNRYVAITGAVRDGGKFPWREGLTVRDLVHMAKGLDDGAYLVRAQVARLPEERSSGQLAKTISVPLDSTYLLERGLDGKYYGPPGIAATTSQAPDFVLQPYDNVLILRQPNWQLERTITVQGEVKFPGDYTLESKSERISDVIRQAGGLNPRAYPGAAVFIRPTDGLGRIGVNLSEALTKPDSRDDFVLLPGDTLLIPEYRPTVKVEGAVNSPITLAYVPGWTLTDYVNGAGGATYNGDKDRAFVRQPNGMVEPYRTRFLLLPNHDPRPEAGATVVVPTKDPNDKKDWLAFAGSVAQIAISTAGILAIVLKN